MATIRDYLIDDHYQCDEQLCTADACLRNGDWEGARIGFRRFQGALERHLTIEENIVFPAFEKTLQGAAGPASMLRGEHRQIRAVVSRMYAALASSDPLDYLIHSETLLILMQQHSLKEEDILYPHLDRLLGDKRHEIIEAMRGIEEIDVSTAFS